MNTSPSIHLGPVGMSIPMSAKRHIPCAWITRSFPGTLNGFPLIVNSRSGRFGTSAQSMVYCPNRLAEAPTLDAILRISAEGPVMRDVPESTIPLVLPEEYDPTWTLSRSMSQYLGSARLTHVMSPVNLESSAVRGATQKVLAHLSRV